MMARLMVFFFFLLVTASVASGEKKAKVITESGKKWDVFFLRMSNDTIYLKARKANGALFSISGHKSKFRKVDFLNGSTLDLTLSNYPPPETRLQSNNVGEYGVGGDSVFRSRTNPAPAPDAPSSFIRTQRSDSALSNSVIGAAKQDSAAASVKSADTAFSSGSHEIGLPTSPMIVDTALEAALSAETKPAKASPVKPIVAKKKKSHAFAFSLCLLSAATLAGSAASYYLFTEDHKKSEEAYESLEHASVLGKPAGDLLDVNKSKHDSGQEKLKYSQTLLGVGAALLAGGIVLYF